MGIRLILVCTVLVCMVMFGMAACGGGPGTDTLDRAVQATRGGGAYRVDVTGTVFGSDQIVLGRLDGNGRMDLAAQVGTLDLAVSPVAGDPYDVTVRQLRGESFQRGLPGFPADTWILVADAPSAITADLPTFLDVDAVLGLLEGLAGDVTDLGRADLDGSSVRQVRLVLPPARIAQAITDVLDAAIPESSARPDLGEPAIRAVAEVWIDDADLVRFVDLNLTVTVGDGQAIPGIGAVDNQVQVRLDPIDEPVEVRRPDPDQSARTDFAELFRAGVGPYSS